MPGVYVARRNILHRGHSAGGGGFTPTSSQSSAFLARATNITLTADKTNYDTLITGLVNDGLFSKLDFLYIFAAPDSTTAKLNLITGSSFNPATYNAPAGPAESSQFSAYHGYTGDGSTVFIDSVTSPGSGNFLQDTASFGAYCVAGVSASNDLTLIGTRSAGGVFSDVTNLHASNSFLYRINTSGGSFQAPANASRPGMYVLSRTGASAYASYKNGTQQDTGTNGDFALTAMSSFYILARNDPGGASGFSFDQVGAAFIGGALSSTEAGNLSTRLNTFMTAYGINAY
jgi:hypothetical protein